MGPSTLRIMLLVLAALAAAVPTTPSATAATVLGSDRGSIGPVVLLDDGALWASGLLDNAPVDLVRGAPGRPSVRLRRLADASAAASSDQLYPSALSVSAGRALVTLNSSDGVKGKYTGNPQVAVVTYLVGLGGGMLTEVARCGEFGRTDAALAWPWLIVVGCHAGVPGPVEAVDLSRPGAPPRRLSAAGAGVQAAGTMVSWRELGAVVVYDLAQQAEVARIATATLPGLVTTSTSEALGVRLQPDGTVGLTYDGPDPPHDTRIALFAPGAAAPAIVVPGGRLSDVRIAGDRLAFVRGGAAAGRSELVVRSLAGDETVVARYLGGFDFDFDGTRAAWVRDRCGGSQILLGEVDGAPIDTQRIGACPLALYAQADQAGGGTYVDVAKRRLGLGAECLRLLPQRPTDRCRVTARVTDARGRVHGTRRITVDAGRAFDLRISVDRALLRSRPNELTLRVATTMRGRTLRTRTTLSDVIYD